MFNISDKVIVNFQGASRIGIIEDVYSNPGSLEVFFAVYIKSLDIHASFLEKDLDNYSYAHIPNSFSIRAKDET